MTGEEFYDLLNKTYINKDEGKLLYNNYHFKKWLYKKNNTYSFQFKGKTQLKAIPKEWLVDAKNAKKRKNNQ
ncbi:hypothetical protein FLJU110815_07110 [Flavobacterium jumunjinense]